MTSRRMFSGFKSLWMKFLSCISHNPSRISFIIEDTVSSSIICKEGSRDWGFYAAISGARPGEFPGVLLCDWFLELCADCFIRSSRVPPFIFSISMNAKSFDSTIYNNIKIIEMFKLVIYLLYMIDRRLYWIHIPFIYTDSRRLNHYY
jgi:hypothetical protein